MLAVIMRHPLSRLAILLVCSADAGKQIPSKNEDGRDVFRILIDDSNNVVSRRW